MPEEKAQHQVSACRVSMLMSLLGMANSNALPKWEWSRLLSRRFDRIILKIRFHHKEADHHANLLVFLNTSSASLMTTILNHNDDSTERRATSIVPSRSDSKKSEASEAAPAPSLNNLRPRRFRRQDCFIEEHDSLRYSGSSSSDESSRLSWFSCSQYEESSAELEYERDDDDDSDFFNGATYRKRKWADSRVVRFTEKPPIVHVYEKPTEAEKQLMYYKKSDYGVLYAQYYADEIKRAMCEEMEVFDALV